MYRSVLNLLAVAIMGGCLPGVAQVADRFEVVSLKLSPPGGRFTSRLNGAQFVCTGHTLLVLIQSSYPDLAGWKVAGGPSWLNTDRWDLTAKLPAGMPTEEEPLYRRTETMLKTFLAEEFGLKTHLEKRETPVYVLTIGKRGSKLKPSEVEQPGFQPVSTGFEFRHQPIDGLTNFLYGRFNQLGAAIQPLDRPVFDETGLAGFFDFTLEWKPERPLSDPTESGPSIFTAIEQLGLKLEPQKRPVEFVVIDAATRPRIN